MNNKQNNTNRGLLDTSRQRTGGQYEDFINKTRTSHDTNVGDDKNLRDTIYDQLMSGNNYMPGGLTPNASGWFDLQGGSANGSSGSGGNVAGGDYSAAKSGYGKFAETGGVNRDDFNPALDSYKGFINNGGIGEMDAQALRTRATAGVPAFYNKYKSALQRRSNVQGGYAPGYDAQMKEIGRDAAREGFEASRQVEGDIVDKRLQGRQFGTSGFGNLMSGITGMEQSGKLAGLGGLKSIGDSEQSNSQFNAGLDETRSGRNQAMQQFLMDMYSSGGKAKASGLQNLYSSTPGASSQSGSQLLGGINSSSGNELNNIMARLGIKDRSFMDILPQLIGMGGGMLPGFGGMGTGGGKSQPYRYDPNNPFN